MSPFKIALFGGSFDPPHRGHIQIIHTALETLELEHLYVIPIGIPTALKNRELTPAHHRLNMCQLAFHSIPKVSICTFELLTAQTSYTYLTIQAFTSQFPQADLYLILGEDNFRHRFRWKNWHEIEKQVQLVVIARKLLTDEAVALDLTPSKCLYIQIPVIADISSTQLRYGIKHRTMAESVLTSHLPPEVIDYIQTHQLYL
ncbi:MAG: nicotinate (nicotinamide) nucleotide adenylyltransferase [Gammaproteobacteria bacterium]|nr:nicotinate (nicotinamide) nucleotide adenylyltransferase [Gammaproteobacteria bacterium]